MSEPRGQPFSGLLDAEERHRASPETFSIPRSEVRRHLAPGSLVKLLFGAGEGHPPPAERMWASVLDVAGDRYVGRLENEPVDILDLHLGDLVRFGPEHVAAIHRPTPMDPRPDQFAIVSSRIWRDGSPPARAARMPSPDSAFSGWVLFAAGDPATPPDDLRGFEPVAHAWLTDRYRSFDSIEDEAPGSAWRWDGRQLEWTRVDGPAPSE